MTYTFKLSRRLAAARPAAALLLGIAGGLAACQEAATAPAAMDDPAAAGLVSVPALATAPYRRLVLQPGTLTLEARASRQFKAYGVQRDGVKVPITAGYQASGGTITPEGRYTADSVAGTGRVIASAYGLTDTTVVTILPPPPPPAPQTPGIPFGPYGAWLTHDSLEPGAELFSSNASEVWPEHLVARIAAARQLGKRILITMTGGSRSKYLTDGVFDEAKWRAELERYNTAAIRQAVADGVADGTILGTLVMDEPQATGGVGNVGWGPKGTMTKTRVDGLCRQMKELFPTLPAGVNADHKAFEPEQAYTVCDFSMSQYRQAKGDVTAYRNAGLAMAARDGHAIVFSMNVLDGGLRDNDKDADWECPQETTGGLGTYAPNCRMTPEQMEAYGRALGTGGGCALLVWRFDSGFMGVPANRSAFETLRQVLDAAPPVSCRRAL